MAIDINKKDCTTSLKGTGTKGCKINFGLISKYIFTDKGTKLDLVNDNLDQAKIDELVSSGKMVIMPNHTFTPQPEATVYQTLSDGSKVKVRDGLFEALAVYTNKGICFGNALDSLESKDWDVWLVDDKNILYFDENVDGTNISGFSTQVVGKDTTAFNDGTNAASYSLLVQFSTSGTNALNSRVGYYADSDVDFLSLEGINDVELEVSGTPGATIDFKALISCDGTTSVAGFETLVRAVDSTGAATTGTAVQNGDIYTWTPDTALATGNYILELYDTGANLDVVKDSEGAYYKSNDLAVTIP